MAQQKTPAYRLTGIHEPTDKQLALLMMCVTKTVRERTEIATRSYFEQLAAIATDKLGTWNQHTATPQK